MKEDRDTSLIAEMSDAYAQHSPRSAALNKRAEQFLIDGGSHALRLIRPFPPRITAARGAWLTDVDGHQILDFWQGHFANLLGHNPPEVTLPLAEAMSNSVGLQTGHTDPIEIETAELACRLTGAEKIRFTTSGSLATMYAIMLARAYTGRNRVMKAGGGWHGGQPWGLNGVKFSTKDGYQHADSAGLPGATADEVLITRYNDPQRLEEQFRTHGNDIACLILELMPGTGGGMPASVEYAQAARRLTETYGALLIVDEVITGFRLRAGPAAFFYGLHPDLATYGKVMGGGMPVAAVAGRSDVMQLAGRLGGERVKFSGGTYSAHPASMQATLATMAHLAGHEAEVYSRLGALGDQARAAIRAACARCGIYAAPTGGASGALPAGSFVQVHFPWEAGRPIERPDDANNPEVCDLVLKDKLLPLALLLEDVFVVHGLGAVSAAHGDAEVDRLGPAFDAALSRVAAHRN